MRQREQMARVINETTQQKTQQKISKLNRGLKTFRFETKRKSPNLLILILGPCDMSGRLIDVQFIHFGTNSWD